MVGVASGLPPRPRGLSWALVERHLASAGPPNVRQVGDSHAVDLGEFMEDLKRRVAPTTLEVLEVAQCNPGNFFLRVPGDPASTSQVRSHLASEFVELHAESVLMTVTLIHATIMTCV